MQLRKETQEIQEQMVGVGLAKGGSPPKAAKAPRAAKTHPQPPPSDSLLKFVRQVFANAEAIGADPGGRRGAALRDSGSDAEGLQAQPLA